MPMNHASTPRKAGLTANPWSRHGHPMGKASHPTITPRVEKAPLTSHHNLERKTGFEPATLTLGSKWHESGTKGTYAYFLRTPCLDQHHPYHRPQPPDLPLDSVLDGERLRVTGVTTPNDFKPSPGADRQCSASATHRRTPPPRRHRHQQRKRRTIDRSLDAARRPIRPTTPRRVREVQSGITPLKRIVHARRKRSNGRPSGGAGLARPAASPRQ